MICTPHRDYAGDDVKKNEMGESRDTYAGGGRNSKEINHFENLGISRRIILKWKLKK
jgi:hypothetical protein